jgi:DNA polymerase-3 subunit alpha
LAAVKTVGEGAVRPIVGERKKNGPYESIDDFCRRADVSSLNRRTLESLIKAGAFDSLGPRGAALKALDQIVATAQLETRMRNTGQASMFGSLSQGSGGAQMPGIVLDGSDVSLEQKAAWERELLGVSLSYNPLFELATVDAGDAINSLDQLDDELQGQSLFLLGHVSSMTERYTREQKKFLIVALDLLGGPVEVIVWPDVLERTQELWKEGKLVKTAGKLRVRGDQFSLACEQVEEYTASASQTSNATPGNMITDANPMDSSPKPANGARKSAASTVVASGNQARTVVLAITESDDAVEDAHLLREVIRVLLEFPGKDRVNLEIYTNRKRVLMELPVVSTGYCEELKERLEGLLGLNSVALYQSDGLEVGV